MTKINHKEYLAELEVQHMICVFIFLTFLINRNEHLCEVHQLSESDCFTFSKQVKIIYTNTYK